MPAIRVYIQSEHFSDIKLIEIDEDASVADLKKAALALLPAGTDVSDLELSVEDEDDDNDYEGGGQLHARRTQVKELAKEHGVRVNLHRCKRIEVSVCFGGEDVHHKFSPADRKSVV